MYYTQVLITPPKPKIADITVNVSDGTNAISGATVTIGTDSETTDEDGEATFDSVYEGSQTVTVTATGYADKTATINVDETNTSFTITLDPVDTLTITVDDGDDTPNAIEGASVKIGSTTKTTDSNGQCTFTDMTYTDYSAEVSKTGYTTKTETLQFRSNHKSFTISLVAEGG